MRKLNLLFLFVFLVAFEFGYSQSSPDYEGGYKIKFNDDGSKYLRIIGWAQFWAQHNDNVPDDQEQLAFSIRRARILMFSQISDDFLLLAHFGNNSMNGDNLSPTGKGPSSQLFFHDVWAQYNIIPELSVGGGLHYWNGISRLNNQSTLNMLTLDNFRQAWATIGLSDQFARHIGVFAKSSIGKFNYQVAVNESITDNLQAGATPVNGGPAIYSGRRLLGSKDAGKNFAGYFDYNILDKESQFLPYKVGSYLGAKEIFNIGGGFFVQPNGSVLADAAGELVGEDVVIFAIDTFYDAPVGDKGAAVTAYAMYQSQDYGEDFTLGTTYETGDTFYSQAGYLIPTDGKVKYQPYGFFGNRNIDALDDNATDFGLGGNVYLNGNNSKITLEYKNSKYSENDANGIVTVQLMIYL